jgi:hypothetical protein
MGIIQRGLEVGSIGLAARRSLMVLMIIYIDRFRISDQQIAKGQ